MCKTVVDRVYSFHISLLSRQHCKFKQAWLRKTKLLHQDNALQTTSINLSVNWKKILANITWKKNHEYKKINSAIRAYTCHFLLSFSQRSGCSSWWRGVCVVCPQNTVHLLPLFFTGGGHSTALMASSNTVFRPRWVSAEHSRYFTAPDERKTWKNFNVAVGAQT